MNKKKLSPQTQDLEALTATVNGLYDAQQFRGLIEDSKWLKYKSFNAGGWAMDNAALFTVYCILDFVRPKKILEFGLGQSSKMIHQYAEYSDNSSDILALTVEHDQTWIDFFTNSFPKEIPLNIMRLDVETISLEGFDSLTYKNVLDETPDADWDFIIVDGPFGSPRFSRPQVLDFVQRGLPKRFCILIDDTNRTGEQDTFHKVFEILESKNIQYRWRTYIGEKKHTIICSEDLGFLTTLRPYIERKTL